MRVEGKQQATRASEQKRNPRRTGAQKRKERGRRGKGGCCWAARVHDGVLECPVHGGGVQWEGVIDTGVVKVPR